MNNRVHSIIIILRVDIQDFPSEATQNKKVYSEGADQNTLHCSSHCIEAIPAEYMSNSIPAINGLPASYHEALPLGWEKQKQEATTDVLTFV